jgi:hypothetical protein
VALNSFRSRPPPGETAAGICRRGRDRREPVSEPGLLRSGRFGFKLLEHIRPCPRPKHCDAIQHHLPRVVRRDRSDLPQQPEQP